MTIFCKAVIFPNNYDFYILACALIGRYILSYLQILWANSFNNTVGPFCYTTLGGINPTVSVHAPVLAIGVFEKDIVSTIVVTVTNGEDYVSQFLLFKITNWIIFTWINAIFVKSKLVIISLKSNDNWTLIQCFSKFRSIII